MNQDKASQSAKEFWNQLQNDFDAPSPMRNWGSPYSEEDIFSRDYGNDFNTGNDFNNNSDINMNEFSSNVFNAGTEPSPAETNRSINPISFYPNGNSTGFSNSNSQNAFNKNNNHLNNSYINNGSGYNFNTEFSNSHPSNNFNSENHTGGTEGFNVNNNVSFNNGNSLNQNHVQNNFHSINKGNTSNEFNYSNNSSGGSFSFNSNFYNFNNMMGNDNLNNNNRNNNNNSNNGAGINNGIDSSMPDFHNALATDSFFDKPIFDVPTTLENSSNVSMSPHHRRSNTAPSMLTTLIQQTSPNNINISANSNFKGRKPPRPVRGIDCFAVGQNSRPIYLPNETSEDEAFMEMCHDQSRVINPHQLGFIPHEYWLDESYEFGHVVRDFFQRKNHPSCRFSHKLYNALKLTADSDFYFTFTGVEWKSAEVLHVNKNRFARLLGIKSIDGSLFHQQGNFPSFGFAELSVDEIKNLLGEQEIRMIDLDVDRFMIHIPKKFVSTCTEEDISDDLKWKGIKQRLGLVNDH